MAAATVTAPRRWVASLISSIAAPDAPGPPAGGNPLAAVAAAKEAFLTLHVLFPHALLPALDLLDRGLVTRLTVAPTVERLPRQGDGQEASSSAAAAAVTGAPDEAEAAEAAAPGEAAAAAAPTNTTQHQKPERDPEPNTGRTEAGMYVYYVRSTQPHFARSSSAHRNAASEPGTYYEVRLDAWSCSCPAFAFSAFPAPSAGISNDHPEPSAHGVSRHTADATPGWRFGGLTRGDDTPVCKHLLGCALVEHASALSSLVEERVVSAEELAGWAAGWGD